MNQAVYTFRIFWKSGKIETITGPTLEDAFTQAGYSENDIEDVQSIQQL